MPEATQPDAQTDEQLMLAFSKGVAIAFDQLFVR